MHLADFEGLIARVSGRQDFEDEAQRPARPPAINNTSLKGARTGLCEGVDYTFKSPGTWELFKKLYPGSGPDIPRPILADGRTEFFLYSFKVHRSSKPDYEPQNIHVSKSVSGFSRFLPLLPS